MKFTHHKNKWIFSHNGKFGELVETSDLAFIVEPKDSTKKDFDKNITYGFDFKTISSLSNSIRKSMKFDVVDKQATVS